MFHYIIIQTFDTIFDVPQVTYDRQMALKYKRIGMLVKPVIKR